MSHSLINRSPDLKRLRDDGYDVAVVAGYLIVSDVPYVDENKQVEFGKLVTDLPISGDQVSGMGSHVAFFSGEHPCDQHGKRMEKISHASKNREIAPGLSVQHSFSSKPVGKKGYDNYHHKMSTYIAIISGQAKLINPDVDARTYPPIEATEEESVFRYHDTNTSRSGTSEINQKLAMDSVAIIGLGGTGAFTLDQLVKTPVENLHLYDGDVFSNHNAFRAPGACSLDRLKGRPMKVEYYEAMYSPLRRGLHAHPVMITEENVNQLRQMGFVFLCLDNGPARKMIIEKLEEFGVPFIDVGMGVQFAEDGSLFGTLRVTTSTPDKREHVKTRKRIPFGEGNEENLYASNIQLSVLNSLNANLAVIKWMKLMGFLYDPELEHHMTYSIDGNIINNEDHGLCPSQNLNIAS